MKFTNLDQINDFLAAVDKAKGNVYLVSLNGDRYNLKSKLSQYISIGALLSECGDTLELYCDLKEDEGYFFSFLINHPEV